MSTLFSYKVGFLFLCKSRSNLLLRGCMGSRQVLPSWGGEAGLTLLKLSILPSSWVLAVLEEASKEWGLLSTREK